MIGWFFAGLAGAVAVAPFLREWARPRMSAAARHAAPGQFATLSKGVTHYQWLGATEGPVAVCVHGLTTPSFVWGPIAERLGAQGFRVLVYDLYGRGYSDRPRGAQTSEFFITQLEELLADQGVREDITLLGYSMGGAIASAYAARHARTLRRLILLAPGGLGHDLGPVADLVVNQKRIGTWLALAFYARSLRQATETERDLPSEIDGMVDLQIAETRWRGFTPAVLSSLRGIMDEDLETVHRKIAKAGVPVVTVWGGDDEIIPVALTEKLRDWNPQTAIHVIEGAGHTIAYTHVDAVMAGIGDLCKPADYGP